MRYQGGNSLKKEVVGLVERKFRVGLEFWGKTQTADLPEYDFTSLEQRFEDGEVHQWGPSEAMAHKIALFFVLRLLPSPFYPFRVNDDAGDVFFFANLHIFYTVGYP